VTDGRTDRRTYYNQWSGHLSGRPRC